MLKAGQEFAHFQIVEKLGEGGMGAVYLARDRKLGRQVALKVLPREFLEDPDRLERFRREAKVAASISHPNVTGIHDLGEATDPESGSPLTYIVMEHVSGVTLAEFVRNRRPEMKTRLRIAEKIAAGLAAAHKLQVVHRDIKPENILVDDEGEPKILDFGLAKPLEPVFGEGARAGAPTESLTADLTQMGKIVGTVQYMSPEQAQGQALDTRSDIFSFGVLLYWLASGEVPFSGPTQVSTLARIIETQPEPVRSRNEAVPAELERIIEKCLRKDPHDRYQDTRDLGVDLRQLRRQYDSDISDSVSFPSGETVAATRARRAPWRVPLLALGGAVVLAVLAIYLLRGFGKGPVADATETRLAILNFENKTQDAELDWLETGLPEILLTDLGQCANLRLIGRDRVYEEAIRAAGSDAQPLSQGQWRRASRKLGATSILAGSFYKMGDRIRIDARLEDATGGKILLTQKVIGEDPFSLVDSLTAKVAASLGAREPAAGPAGVAEITTRSTEAYKEYRAGEEKLFLGLYDEARERYQAALAIDSTFALPYMAIAMSQIFEGRLQLGAESLRKAARFKGKLPAQERSLLDIYSDLWVHREFGDAMAKLDAYVDAYPEDREARSMHATVVAQLAADTSRAFTEFREILADNPAYALALDQFAVTLDNHGRTDQAVKVMQQFRRYHPDSPIPYRRLGDFYIEQGKFEDATAAYEEYRKRFPEEPRALSSLSALAVRRRDFDGARRYLEQMRRLRPDDPQWQRNYYANLGNIEIWNGRFHHALRDYDRVLDSAFAMDDSTYVYFGLLTLAELHGRFGQPDSAQHYLDLSRAYELPTARLNYPFLSVRLNPDNADRVRPLMVEGVEAFKARTPDTVWKIADIVEEIFDAYAARDTTALIAAYQKMHRIPGYLTGSEHDRELAELLLSRGRYHDALEVLQPLVASDDVSTSAYTYLMGTYLIGRCEEGLGDLAGAAEKYREFLGYWGKPEIELKEIVDARRRLQRMTS